MDSVFKDILLFIVAPIITLLLGWILGNRKSVAEVRNLELDATQKAIDIWKELAHEIQVELKETNNENSKEVADLKSEIGKLRTIVEELRKENEELKKHIHSLKQSI